MQRRLSLDLIYLFNRRQTGRIRRKINILIIQRFLVSEFIQRVLRVLFDNIRKNSFLSALLTKLSISCVMSIALEENDSSLRFCEMVHRDYFIICNYDFI